VPGAALKSIRDFEAAERVPGVRLASLLVQQVARDFPWRYHSVVRSDDALEPTDRVVRALPRGATGGGTYQEPFPLRPL